MAALTQNELALYVFNNKGKFIHYMHQYRQDCDYWNELISRFIEKILVNKIDNCEAGKEYNYCITGIKRLSIDRFRRMHGIFLCEYTELYAPSYFTKEKHDKYFKDLISDLSDSDKTLMILRYKFRHKYSMISDSLNKPLGTVKVDFFRIKSKLQENKYAQLKHKQLHEV